MKDAIIGKYPKIETLFERDPNTLKVIKGTWRTPEFEYLKDRIWLFTEKVNGTNIRVMWDGEMISFDGRYDDAQIPASLLARLQALFLSDKLRQVFANKSVCLYGEGYGNHIQKTGSLYIPTSVDFVLFDVVIEGWWLRRNDIEDISRTLDIDVVPIIGEGTLEEAAKLAEAGFVSHWSAPEREFLAEGLVVRPKVDLFDRRGKRIIGKIKHKDF